MESRLGRIIHGIRDEVFLIGEVYRFERAKRGLHREEDRAGVFFLQALQELGGIDGIRVTDGQIARYLKADLVATIASARVIEFYHPRWPSSQSRFVRRAEMAQVLQTSEGRQTAIEIFSEAKTIHADVLSRLSGIGRTQDTKEELRRVIACDTAISFLTSSAIS